MAKPEVAKKKVQSRTAGAENDIYTVLLALAALALAGTSAWACMKSLEFFEKLF